MEIQFPGREEYILELALRMADHLEQQGEVCPPPPLSPATLRAIVADIKARHTNLVKAEQHYRDRRVRRQCGLAQVKDALKEKLVALDIEVRGEPERDPALKWGGCPGATDQELPGAVRHLTAERLGHTSVLLEWRPRVSGSRALR